MRVKNHQKLATVRVDTARGKKSQPWTDTPEVLTLGLFNKTFKETLSQIFGLHFFPQKTPLSPLTENLNYFLTRIFIPPCQLHETLEYTYSTTALWCQQRQKVIYDFLMVSYTVKKANGNSVNIH
jgi:hypothetical protein